ncbi:MAG TPA: radical SAM protein [Armatimonadota bacterium]|nr:radical SAM protein [Armatimonadota bacterium]HQK94400.1 radical SAM protein [Armatimonadota bacterium]
MSIRVEEIQCKSALTGSGGRFRLNPYCGCEHSCAYCYATYLTRWRGQSAPWGSWVQVKTNIARVLECELARRRVAHVMLSTACDAYQPVEEHYRLTRRCLSVLAIASQKLDGPSVFVLTKSDRVLGDLDVLRMFPEGSLRVAFSVTTHRDDVAAILEPGAPSPSARIAAATALVAEGICVELFINPVLPYITERDMPALLDAARVAGCGVGGFDRTNYLDRQPGARLRAVYRHLGPEAQERLEQARNERRSEVPTSWSPGGY